MDKKLRRILSILVVVAMLLPEVVRPDTVRAGEVANNWSEEVANDSSGAATSEGWSYEPYTYEGEEGVAITAYQGEEVDVTVPEALDGKLVLAVRAEAFKDDGQINSVTLANSVRVVEEYAFAGCVAMRCAILNDGLVEMGDYAFAGNEGMNSIIIYPSTTTIGEHAFEDCENLLVYCYTDSAAYLFAGSHGVACQTFDGGKIVMDQGITYLVANGEGTVISCDRDKEGEVEVPSEMESYPVTTIGAGAFSECEGVTRVVLPDTVADIGARAFGGMTSLTKVNMPGGVVKFPKYMFHECYKLRAVDFPAGLKEIGDCAFLYSGIKSAVLPMGVVGVGESAFGGSRLESVTIQGSPAFGWDVFSSCRNLSDVKFLGEGAVFGLGMFYGCESLKRVVMPSGVSEIPDGMFRLSGLEELEVPPGVTRIGDGAFGDCTSLQKVVVPRSVEKIEDDAFSGCGPLLVCCHGDSYTHKYAVEKGLSHYLVTKGREDVTIGRRGSLRYIVANEDVTILSCDRSQKGEVEVPSEMEGLPVTTIGAGAFSKCEGVTRIVLPDTVTGVGMGAFDGMSSLTEVNIPSGVVKFPKYMFRFCGELRAVDFPTGLKEIEDCAFGYSGIKSAVLPMGVERVGGAAFSGSELESVTIQGSPTFGSEVFSSCRKLSDVKFLGEEAVLGSGMFRQCESLRRVTMPSWLSEIPSVMFAESGLEELEVPSGVTRIGDSAFADCVNLQKVVVPKSVEYIGDNAFKGCGPLLVCCHEDSYTHKYAVEEGLSHYLVTTGDGEVTIGRREGLEYIVTSAGVTIFSCDRSKEGEVEVPSEMEGLPVTTIGAGAFLRCEGVTRIVLPDTVTSIGASAFSGMSSLMKVNIPSGVVRFSDHMFWECHELRAIDFPTGLKEIGDYAFYYSGIKSAILPMGVERVGEYAFLGSKLESVAIQGAPIFGDYAFAACRKLSDVRFLGEEAIVGSSGMFAYCASLKKVGLPSGMDEIPDGMFLGSGLEELEVPLGVTTIGDLAFANCANLQKVVVPKSVWIIYGSVFNGCGSVLVYCHLNSDAYQYATERNMGVHLMDGGEPGIDTGTPLRGRVANVYGVPASGIMVELLNPRSDVLETVMADKTGMYMFEHVGVGRYTIRATSQDGRIGVEQVSVRRMTVLEVMQVGNTNITVKDAVGVSGRVTLGSDGVDGATVVLVDENGNTTATAMSDTNGYYEINGVTNGSYAVRAIAESGGAVAEITLFNRDVECNLEIEGTTAQVAGRVAKSDGVAEKAEVILYNMEGFVVGGAETDVEGAYVFDNVPHGDYVVSAAVDDYSTGEIVRLVGSGYVKVQENKRHVVDVMVVRQTSGEAKIRGKVTYQGHDQKDSIVVLKDVFENEKARFQTGASGKYSFGEVGDGVYHMLVTTKNEGAGYSMVIVKDGLVTGNTDIAVSKSRVIREHEETVAEIPMEDAESYVETIADEKEFYDGLSDRQKDELNTEYVEKLDALIGVVTDYGVECSDNLVEVNEGGLVVSADEIRDGREVGFQISVTKEEEVTIPDTGVSSEEEFVQQLINQAVGEGEAFAYYDVGMTKNMDEVGKKINTISKDTDTTGNLEVTIEIPEADRGHEHYSAVHVHNGQVFELEDVDDNPNTITIHVNKFSTFALMYDDWVPDCHIEVGGTEGGMVAGGGWYAYGEKVTVAAAAGAGYRLGGWYEDGKSVSNAMRYAFSATRNRVLNAHFSMNAIPTQKPIANPSPKASPKPSPKPDPKTSS